MIAYLESGAVTRPTTLTATTESENAEPTGSVTSTIEHGELFLHPVGDRQAWFRLRWDPDDELRTRPLPAGNYVLTGYRQLAEGDDGVPWIWSTSSVGFRRIEVVAEETTHVEVRSGIDVRTRAFLKRGKPRVGLVFVAEKKLGNTLYRDGKRIAIRWQCLDDEGTVLADGPMRYG